MQGGVYGVCTVPRLPATCSHPHATTAHSTFSLSTGNVKKFFNRLLGTDTSLQNGVFGLFIQEMKAETQRSPDVKEHGVVEIDGNVTLAESEVFLPALSGGDKPDERETRIHLLMRVFLFCERCD